MIALKLPRQRLLFAAKNIVKNNAVSCSCRFYNDIPLEHIPEVTVTSMKRSLKEHLVKFEEGHACIMVGCPACKSSTTKEKSAQVFINKITGFFTCQCAKYAGSWPILEKFYASKANENALEEFFKKTQFNEEICDSKEVNGNMKLFAKCSEKMRMTILEKFNFPITWKPSLILLDVMVDAKLETLYFPLLGMEAQIVGYKALNYGGPEERLVFTSERSWGLVGGRAVRAIGPATAVLVPTLRDAVALLQAKVSAHVFCLPYGSSSLPQTLLPQLEQFEKLVLWFGNDTSSWDAARVFAKKLGERRCYIVRPTDDQPCVYVAATLGLDLRGILTEAQPVWHKAIITFASLRQDVLAELHNMDKVQGVKWRRFPTLAKILKGHRRGELTVITGPTGCGKTTFMSEYSLDLAMQGVNTLWGSFEIRNARLARTMLQQLSGCQLDEHLDQFDSWADNFERLPIYFMTFHGQQTIRVVMDAVEHAAYVHDIAHVVVDNVQFMMGMSEEPRHSDRFWKQDAVVAAFRTFATRKNCHVTLVMHPRKERDAEELTTSSIFGGAKASQEADNVLIIQDKRLTSLRGKKYLQVVKNRYSGDLGIMPMDFDKAALSYAQKPKKTSPATKENQSSQT